MERAAAPLDALPLDRANIVRAMERCGDQATSLTNFRACLEGRLCWVDGTPTHLSSDSQRQCPRCRAKWSYEHLTLQFALLEQYCQGTNAAQAAKAVGCSRNTSLKHFGEFRKHMELSVAAMLLDGVIATQPVSTNEWRSLERALRTGDNVRRSRVCRHLFMASLRYEERLEILYSAILRPAFNERIEANKKKAPADQPPSPKPRGRRNVVYSIPGRFRRGYESAKSMLDGSQDVVAPHCLASDPTWFQLWEMSYALAGCPQIAPPPPREVSRPDGSTGTVFGPGDP